MWLGKLQLLSVSILSSENRDYNRLYFVGFCVSKVFTKYISLQNLSGLRQQKFTSCHITLVSVGQLQLCMALFHVSSHSNTQFEGEYTVLDTPILIAEKKQTEICNCSLRVCLDGHSHLCLYLTGQGKSCG